MGEKFLFDKNFGDGGARRRKKAETFTEEDLAAARAEGYAEGQRAGHQEARQEIEAAASASLSVISEQIDAASEQLQTALGDCRREAAEVAVTVGRKLAGNLIEAHPLAAIEALIVDCIGELRDEPRLVIRASDGVTEAIRERISAIAASAGFDGHLVMLPDETMTDSDCRVEWADGGAALELSRTEALIERAVRTYLTTDNVQ
ncbi:FliH/SctL family protein [Minwuia thermotolerans]|uniref:Flagellar assembly protein H n=1 Tax=Minwuia thermotolerans TaxID=2056226 RepID=A0A2M9FYD3_9PROT|nr:FliH/SctL family protein [Minwuia thermotolerans]PJK28449.1 flagellar assembly protein H [Minwuia thermotolerans]